MEASTAAATPAKKADAVWPWSAPALASQVGLMTRGRPIGATGGRGRSLRALDCRELTAVAHQ
eukprot:6694867-Alexandrium_andersonii.AAC.1